MVLGAAATTLGDVAAEVISAEEDLLPGAAPPEEARPPAPELEGAVAFVDEEACRVRGLLVVFGASGGTGVCVLQEALQQGYSVRAFVRSRPTLEAALLDNDLLALAEHAGLEVREGDLHDFEAVEAAIAGARAVISVAGAKPETMPGPMAEAVPAMVEACRRHGVRKLIVQTCALCALPTERIGWLTQQFLVRNVVRWQLGSTVVDDNDRVIAFLIQSAQDLDWVVSRPPGLVDGDSLGPLAPCLDEFRTAPVRYPDVAAWTVAQVESNAYVGKAPRLYYPPVLSPI